MSVWQNSKFLAYQGRPRHAVYTVAARTALRPVASCSTTTTYLKCNAVRHFSNRPRAIVDDITDEAFDILGTGQQTSPFTSRYNGFSLQDAYKVTAALRAKREARGERPVGRKIGFTNYDMWAEYDVHAPIWSYIYSTTVHDFSTAASATSTATGSFSLKGLAEPKIEPEIVFGLRKAPEPGMSEDDLLDCIDWVAHGVEVVQSVFPGWKFSAADTVAAYGLHGALLLGPRHSVHTDKRRAYRPPWKTALCRFSVQIGRDYGLQTMGRGTNVLGSPLKALGHLIDLLAKDPHNPPLMAGEMITTGTLTPALSVESGDTWFSRLHDMHLTNMRIHFEKN